MQLYRSMLNGRDALTMLFWPSLPEWMVLAIMALKFVIVQCKVIASC